MSDSVIAHLTFIQNAITRMGQNSFLIKGWSITLTSAFIAAAISMGNPSLMYFGLLPIAYFWFSDAQFFKREKDFRALYELVVEGKGGNGIDSFCMNPNVDAVKSSKKSIALYQSFFSSAVWPVYLIQIFLILLLVCLGKSGYLSGFTAAV